MMWWFGHPVASAWGMGLIILMVLLVAAIIALIVWAVSRLGRNHKTRISGRQDALDIAKERYARGEITKEQFDQIKKDLQT
jgi:putative membrane protein